MWKQIYSATNSLSDYKEPTETNKSQIKQRKNLKQWQNCHKFPQNWASKHYQDRNLLPDQAETDQKRTKILLKTKTNFE